MPTLPTHLRALFALVLCAALLLPIALPPVRAQSPQNPPPEFTLRQEPAYLLAAYFNAINLKDYARAYAYWETPFNDQTLEQFAAGFATTAHIEAYLRLPILEDAGAGNVYAQLPTLIAATQTDGSTQVFSACYIAHKTNVPIGDNPEPDPNWGLNNATVAEIKALDFSDVASACEEAPPLVFDAPFDNARQPLDLLVSYFNAILDHDYARAYAYWETPPNSQSLESFAQGFAQTAYVNLFVRLAFDLQGAAGSNFFSTPALVIATESNTTQKFFAGCYIMRSSNVPVGDNPEPDPNWRFFDADIQEAASLPDALDILNAACTEPSA